MVVQELVRPKWNKHRRELTVDGEIAKRYRRASPAQIAILEAFESMAWPESIADPLDGGPKKLHNALSKLNRRQGPAFIRFELNGIGRIIWTVGEKCSTGQGDSCETDGG